MHSVHRSEVSSGSKNLGKAMHKSYAHKMLESINDAMYRLMHFSVVLSIMSYVFLYSDAKKTTSRADYVHTVPVGHLGGALC